MVKTLLVARRRIGPNEKLNIIWSIYGSLTDFKNIIKSPTNVAVDLGYNRKTIYSLLFRLKKAQYNVKEVIKTDFKRGV